MTTPALEGLADLARDARLHEGVLAQAQAARRAVVDARIRLDDAVAALAVELDDVERLESISMTRILAAMRGSRDMDLDRERAEMEAAKFTANSEAARLQAAEREVAALHARLEEFGNLAVRRTTLLAQREAELAADPTPGPTATRLTALTSELGGHEGVLVEIDEAIAASHTASSALAAATGHLGGAGNWATYDTFLGGGMVSDFMKYDRLDRAGELMGAADAAMSRLAIELADVDMSGVGGLEVTELTRFFDVWFDNVFSDWAVRDKIRNAADRVTTAAARVVQVRLELEARRGKVLALRDGLAAEREQLLGAQPDTSGPTTPST